MADDPTISLLEPLENAYRTLRVRGTVVLAVSGGADSMALLRATCAIARQIDLDVVVAHLDHALRPEGADEARFVAAAAMEQGARFAGDRVDVRRESASTQRGIEETARRLRYEFLTRIAVQCGAAFVATAHTRNDLAETVLFHALRGTGLRGLRGIAARRRLNEGVTLVRPLLQMSRGDIERYLAAIGQNFVHDASNDDPAFARNRMRNGILPLLRETVNPRLDEALVRLAAQAGEAAALAAVQARRELQLALIESTPHVIRLRSRRLAKRRPIVIRETVAQAWRRAGWPLQAMGYTHWNAIAAIVVDGGRRTLPGETDVRRRRGELILRRTMKKAS